jgi:hypothetical protein
MFSDLLPDSVVSTLRASGTAALAAAMIIARSFPDIVSFAARVTGAPHGPPDAPKPQKAKRSNAHARRSNGRVREAPDQCDERLAQAMKGNPGVSIAALAAAIGKSRTSTVSALHRPRQKPERPPDADRADDAEGDQTLDRAGRHLAPRPRGRARARSESDRATRSKTGSEAPSRAKSRPRASNDDALTGSGA